MDWRRILTYVTGTVDEEMILGNEYLAVENRILRARVKGRLALTCGRFLRLPEGRSGRRPS